MLPHFAVTNAGDISLSAAFLVPPFMQRLCLQGADPVRVSAAPYYAAASEVRYVPFEFIPEQLIAVNDPRCQILIPFGDETVLRRDLLGRCD